MFGTFVKYQFQRTYDAILAAPVDTEELVTAEALWMAIRAGVYGCVPLLVALVFGLDPAWGMLTVPGIAFVAGFGWACASASRSPATPTRSRTSATSSARSRRSARRVRPAHVADRDPRHDPQAHRLDIALDH
jgi:hypothetical protein